MLKNVFRSILLLALALSIHCFASSPQFFEFLSQEELLKGTLKGVSLASDGKIVIAPRYEMAFNTGQPYVFSMAKDGLGNVYLGSGHEGKVFKVGPRGGEGAGNLFFKSKELDIYALAVDPKNNLYVASSPDGKIYKVGPDGNAVEFFDPKEKYIWALAFDPQNNLFVATGGRGVIYKVDPSGKGAKFFDSQETHIMSLAVDHEGNLLAGSAPNAYVYRISPEGKGFVLYDSPLNEIRTLALDRYGNIYAAALSATAGDTLDVTPLTKPNPVGGPPISGRTPEPTVTIQVEEVKSDSRSGFPIKGLDKDLGKVKASIYQIFRDGSVETIWNSKEDSIYSLLVREDGNLLVSTGTKGRILSINQRREVTILVESTEEQITTMLAQGNTIYAASSNLGKLFLLRPEKTLEGSYESEVKDTKTISSWGVVTWHISNPSAKAIELYSRSGNTEKPNKTWSEWAGPYKLPDGERIRSPRARYLQWKAVFGANPGDNKLISQTDALEKVTVAYLQQNIRPRITSINILPPGIGLQKVPIFGPSYIAGAAGSPLANTSTGASGQSANPASALSKPKYKIPPQQKNQPGARSIVWKAEDDNDDDLIYQIYFKAEGEQDWKLLDKELTDEFYTIDSNALPDGIYQVKIVASDAPSNAYGTALTTEQISKPFIIDNTPPVIEVLSHKILNPKVELNLRVKDNVSKIIQLEFSVDGGEWHIVFPKDGISDSKIEEYNLVVDVLKAGEHTIGLKATDGMGNVGTNKLVVKLPMQ